MRKKTRLSILVLFALLTGAASADGPLPRLLTAADAVRLERLPDLRATALAAVRASDSAETRELVDRVLDAPPAGLDGSGLEGEWRCRLLRIAGDPARLEVNDWFTCRLDDDGAGLALVKQSGGWRTRGRFFDLGESRMAYLGVRGPAADGAARYGQDPALDQVAVAVSPGRDRLRLEFPPAPTDPWRLEILELRRAARTEATLCAPSLSLAFSCPHAKSNTVAALCEGAAGPVLRLGRQGVVELELPGVDGAAAPTLLREPDLGGELLGLGFTRGEWQYVMSHFVGGRPVQASAFLSIRHRGAPAIALPCAVPPQGVAGLAEYLRRFESAEP